MARRGLDPFYVWLESEIRAMYHTGYHNLLMHSPAYGGVRVILGPPPDPDFVLRSEACRGCGHEVTMCACHARGED